MKRIAIAVAVLLAASRSLAGSPAEDVEFFENKIRPVLAQHCYECHNSLEKKEGGLALDYKDALLAGGDSGKVLIAGKPDESVLIWALRHENGYEMPSKAPKLDDAVIRDFERWVQRGAVDPRVARPTANDLVPTRPWEQIRDQRKRWWAFQPLAEHPLPEVDDPQWSRSPIDRFVYERMRRAGLSPRPEASPEVLVRRVHLILTGLPPSPEVVQAFVADPSAESYERLVDELLASSRFGERWARHWMDWYRYAESHGSEGDPQIPHARQYRDYLIRALNADVPYDQLLREHLAGDLLPRPRVNDELGLNESAIGPAHLRMVPHGFGVTDAYGEQITFVDNQIDVISKAMLGVTVSCSRCHNHKFDPISQQDFYRFFGVLVASRASTVLVDSPQRLDTNKTPMLALKDEIRRAFADLWLAEIDQLPARLDESAERLKDHRDATRPLAAWVLLREAPPEAYPARIEQLVTELQRIAQANEQAVAQAEFYVDLRDPAQRGKWNTTGNGTASEVAPAGSFALAAQGDHALAGIYPRGIYSHLISDKHAAVFTSGNFKALGTRTLVRAAGNNAQLRVPIRNYPLTHGGLHPPTGVGNAPTLAWRPAQPKWNYWQGELVHYELRTAGDTFPQAGGAERSWFGITEIFAGDQPPQPLGASLVALVDNPAAIRDRDTLLTAYRDTLRRVVERWRGGQMTDAEAEFLDDFVRLELVTHRVDRLPEPLRQLIAEYRRLESEIPIPTRAPGVIDVEPVDYPLLVRGDYKQEAEPVPRGFLEVFAEGESASRPVGADTDASPAAADPRASGEAASRKGASGETASGEGEFGNGAAAKYGRLELAEDMVSPANTLKTRVLVNRLWNYVFGRGIAASTDNFGRLGERPTHPELLDYLALDFERNGWSIKQALKQMVTSRTFKSSSLAPQATRDQDPQNILLSHFTPRRLDAEAIYDSINQLGGRNERAVFLPVIRNDLNSFLATFNAPVPISTVSFRNHTNVPAQSLALMNGELVERAARAWAERIERSADLPTPEAKIAAMFQQAYARPPAESELRLLLGFLSPAPAGDDRLDQLTARQRQAQHDLAAAGEALEALLGPVRARLQRDLDRQQADAPRDARPPLDAKPIARWDFEQDARDLVGQMHGELQGDAKIADGALVLRGGCLLTAPIDKPLRAKTLEVLVQLDRLEQSGGGAMSVQTLDGNVFDAVVYGEKTPGVWLPGSDLFRRTVVPQAAPEREATERPVRIIIVFQIDGTIRVYRDGAAYGKPYRTSVAAFEPGRAQVALGLRHGTAPAAGRMLAGRILEASLYDRALSAEEVAAVSLNAAARSVTTAMVLEALSADERQRAADLKSRVDELQQTAARLAQQVSRLQGEQALPRGGLFGVAHALLNSKEFIYVH